MGDKLGTFFFSSKIGVGKIAWGKGVSEPPAAGSQMRCGGGTFFKKIRNF